jgi:hypothetical protein
MPSIINASNSTGLTLTSDLSGQLQFQNNGVNLPMGGVAPAFLAYPSTNVTITSGTQPVMVNNTEVFDTASCFNNTGSTVGGIPAYAFLPNVAGYYLFTVVCTNEASTAPTRFALHIDKNGVAQRVADNFSTLPSCMGGSVLLYMNGTTDYATASPYIAATTAIYNGTIVQTRFSGFLARGA